MNAEKREGGNDQDCPTAVVKGSDLSSERKNNKGVHKVGSTAPFLVVVCRIV